MSAPENDFAPEAGTTPATPLDISGELAAAVDSQLQIFAENAELDTALVVHRSGALVSGISSEEQVTVDVISALVAAANGAMEALARKFGEFGELESFHQGGEQTLYFRGIPRDFILVGVCPSRSPVGMVREGARQIVDALERLLADVDAPSVVPSRSPAPERVSLRPAAPAIPEGAVEAGPGEGHVEAPEEEPPVEEAAPAPEEPREVIEYIDDGNSEIVFEDESGNASSPFEAEEDDEEEFVAEAEEPFAEESGAPEPGAPEPGAPEPAASPPNESIFEAVEEDEELEEEAEPGLANDMETGDPGGSSIFEIDHFEDEVEEISSGVGIGAPQLAPFELDEESEEDTGVGEIGAGEDAGSEVAPFELDDSAEESENREEESEMRSAGPFYF